jgi:tetratricopeptide (TPR) repeat protein
MIHKEILAFDQAEMLLESALEIARETNSVHWTRLVSAELASVLIESGRVNQAEELLEAAISPKEPARSLGQRDVWCKRIELALSQGDMQSAIEGIELLDSWAKNKMTSPASIYVDMLHGRVFSRQRNWLQAEEKFQAVLKISDELGFPGIGWRCCNELANIAGVRGDARQVERYHQQADTLIDRITAHIPQGSLRETFIGETEKIQNRSVSEWQSQ